MAAQLALIRHELPETTAPFQTIITRTVPFALRACATGLLNSRSRSLIETMTTVKKLASSRRRPNLNPRNGMNIRSNFAVQRNNPAAGDSAKICRAERCMFYANSDFIIRRSTQTRAMKPLKPRAVFSAVPVYPKLRSYLATEIFSVFLGRYWAWFLT